MQVTVVTQSTETGLPLDKVFISVEEGVHSGEPSWPVSVLEAEPPLCTQPTQQPIEAVEFTSVQLPSSGCLSTSCLDLSRQLTA